MNYDEKVERLNRLLNEAIAILSECAGTIGEIGFHREEPNIKRIGESILNLSEIHRQIWIDRPDLMRDDVRAAIDHVMAEEDTDPGR